MSEQSDRLFPGKQYGLILDYSGVIKELDEAIDFYTNLAAFDQEDLDNTISYIEDESKKLEKDIQTHTDALIKQIGDNLAKKEQELLKV